MFQLGLVPLSFSNRARNKTGDGSWNWKRPLLSSCNQSNLSKVLLVPLGLSSRSGNQSSCSRDWQCSILSSCSQSNLSKLCLVPLSFTNRARNKSRDCSWDWKCSLLSSCSQSNLSKLLLVPLSLGSGSGN